MMNPFTPAEAYISSDQAVLAVSNKGGGYNFYVTVEMSLESNNRFGDSLPLRDVPGLRERIVDAQFSILRQLRVKR